MIDESRVANEQPTVGEWASAGTQVLPPEQRHGVLERMVTARWPVALVVAGCLVGAWQLMGALGRLPVYVLSPAEVVSAVWSYLTDGTLSEAAVVSLRRLAVGFAIGAGLGVTLGLLAGVVPLFHAVIDPLVSFTFPLPKIALFPPIALWLGFSDRAIWLVIALACFYPSFINAVAGTRGIDRHHLWVAGNLTAGHWRTFWQVVFPAALPRLLVGVRISLALSFVMVFATEAISSRPGLGSVIVESYQFLRYDRMYAAIALLAVLGLIADRLLVWIARSGTRGHDIAAVGRG